MCAQCLMDLPLTGFAPHAGNQAERQLKAMADIEAATSLMHFGRGEISQRVVHSIKYHGNSELALMMGRQLGIALQGSGRFGDVEVLVPVPLHAWRRLKRGYNQSRLLCEGIAQVFSCPVVGGAVRRARNTGSQTHMSPTERRENVAGAFSVVRPEAVAGRHVLLVDDVMTTGATLAACAGVLLAVEGVKVSVATLCVA